MSDRDRLSYSLAFLGLAGRVRVCSVCEMPRAFAGFELAHAEGWRWKLGRRCLVWWCAACRPADVVAVLPRGDVRVLARVAGELGLGAPRRAGDVHALAKVAQRLGLERRTA